MALIDVMPDGKPRDAGYDSLEDLLNAYTDSYEDVLRDILPYLDLVFQWEKDMMGGRNNIMCECLEARRTSPCGHKTEIDMARKDAHLRALELTVNGEEEE